MLNKIMAPMRVAKNARLFSSVWSDSVKARVTLPAPAFQGMAWTDGGFK